MAEINRSPRPAIDSPVSSSAAFETRAAERGCRTLYLETLSFQAPQFYASLGYRVVFELAAFPHGIVKFTMLREIGGGDASA